MAIRSQLMKLEDKIEKANVLLEALPYIKRFSGKSVVIKYGGSIMFDEVLKKQFANDIVLLKYVGIHPIIIHGGGKEISKWMQRVGKEAVFIDGLRFTDLETMEITEMVLSGKINNEIVSLINEAGGQAVGLSGKDGNLFTAERVKSKKNQDLGFVGDIKDVDISLLETLSNKGFIPIISSVGKNKAHETLNMNADHVAQAVATAFNAMKLIYLTDVQGLQINGELQSLLSIDEAIQLLTHEDVKEGMLPKLTCACDAIKSGVDRVHIINGTIPHATLLELFTDTGIGTMIEGKNP